ncbi:hypothetical protein jhhlp_001855 [Lomentospora prolificans]|uniref:Xylanolytic transcriptional activator regulatory domain-containing protein n=1 Tax=Lomentospora prolificans TaxID=41688 RepID=A0A2N3NCD1_9PEZI|nr:hypothetical protein jhhlp_001855 [Lomentospora prolificans]
MKTVARTRQTRTARGAELEVKGCFSTLSTPTSSPRTLRQDGSNRSAPDTGARSSPPTLRIPKLFHPDRSTVQDVSFGQIHIEGCHVGHISTHYGIPVFSSKGRKLIFALSGEEPAFDEEKPGPNTGLKRRAGPLAPTGVGFDDLDARLLPPRQFVETIFQTFIKSAESLVFPFIDRVLFADTIRIAYEPVPGDLSEERLAEIACLFAFISLSRGFENFCKDSSRIDSDAYASRAQTILDATLEDMNMTLLQTALMLLMYHMFSGRFHSAYKLHAVACRLVLMLGGHLAVSNQPVGSETSRDAIEKRHLRTLFWLCYVFDKDLSLRNGLPPMINDEFCDMSLPPGYPASQYTSRPFGDPTEDINYEGCSPHFPADLLLHILKAKACRMLYSAAALRKSDAELLRDIRELDAELESWRMSIPASYRPVISAPNNPYKAATHGPSVLEGIHRVMLQLEYHSLMVTIHRVVGRYNTWHKTSSGEGTDGAAGVRSSLALSVEVSRSTLIFLRESAQEITKAACLFSLFFLIGALTAVFFHILMNPLDPQSPIDVELLDSSSILLKKLSQRVKLTADELLNFSVVERFIRELVRLGRCAILKAQKSVMTLDK